MPGSAKTKTAFQTERFTRKVGRPLRRKVGRCGEHTRDPFQPLLHGPRMHLGHSAQATRAHLDIAKVAPRARQPRVRLGHLPEELLRERLVAARGRLDGGPRACVLYVLQPDVVVFISHRWTSSGGHCGRRERRCKRATPPEALSRRRADAPAPNGAPTRHPIRVSAHTPPKEARIARRGRRKRALQRARRHPETLRLPAANCLRRPSPRAAAPRCCTRDAARARRGPKIPP